MNKEELEEYKAQTERMAVEFQINQLKFQREVNEQKQLFDKFQQIAAARQLAYETKQVNWSQDLQRQLEDITKKIYPLSNITL